MNAVMKSDSMQADANWWTGWNFPVYSSQQCGGEEGNPSENIKQHKDKGWAETQTNQLRMKRTRQLILSKWAIAVWRKGNSF